MIITTAANCYSSKRLISEFSAKFNTTPTILNPKQLNSNQWLGYQSKYPTLIRSTGINYDDSDLFFAKTFSTPMIQSIDELTIFRDKLRQILWCQENKLAIPTSEYNYDQSSQLGDGPFIVKSRRGMRGLGITYIENRKSLLSLLKTLHSIGDQQFLVQKYIDATEFRYFVVAGEIKYVLKKERQDSIIGNAGSNTIIEITTEYPTEQIKKIIPLIKSHYYAVDLLQEKQEYVLEINLAPGFEQLEQLSQDNIAKLIWDKAF